MPMWPESTNPYVAPPVIQSMPGRPKKVRRKEATKTKKSGKLPKTRLAMTCSTFKGKVHNKKKCPNSDRFSVGS